MGEVVLGSVAEAFEEAIESTVGLVDGGSAMFSTTYTSFLFYTSSVVSRYDLKRYGFSKDLKFSEYAVPYSVSKTTSWVRFLDGELTTTSTSVSNTFYYEELNLPAGSVGIMASYKGDYVSDGGTGDSVIEYNVTDNVVKFEFETYDDGDDLNTRLIEPNEEYWESTFADGGSVNWSTSEVLKYGAKLEYDQAEKDFLKLMFETSDDSMTISGSAADIFSDFIKDVYNAAPVNRYVFRKTPSATLKNYNMQPLLEEEGAGGTMGEAPYASREITDIITY